MGNIQKKILLYFILLIEILWTVNLFSIYYAPQQFDYQFENSYWTASHLIEIPSLRGVAAEQHVALNNAQRATIPYIIFSLIAIGFLIFSLVNFKHNFTRRISWIVSLMIMMLMIVLFL